MPPMPDYIIMPMISPPMLPPPLPIDFCHAFALRRCLSDLFCR